MAILDLIPQLFSTGSGASTLDLARGNSFVMAHPWLLPLALGLAMFALAMFAKPVKSGLRTSNRFVWIRLGVGCLIIALLFAVGVIHT
jgi:hypothetical protein